MTFFGSESARLCLCRIKKVVHRRNRNWSRYRPGLLCGIKPNDTD